MKTQASISHTPLHNTSYWWWWHGEHYHVASSKRWVGKYSHGCENEKSGLTATTGFQSTWGKNSLHIYDRRLWVTKPVSVLWWRETSLVECYLQRVTEGLWILPWALQLPLDGPSYAGFLCNKAAILTDTIKETYCIHILACYMVLPSYKTVISMATTTRNTPHKEKFSVPARNRRSGHSAQSPVTVLTAASQIKYHHIAQTIYYHIHQPLKDPCSDMHP